MAPCLALGATVDAIRAVRLVFAAGCLVEIRARWLQLLVLLSLVLINGIRRHTLQIFQDLCIPAELTACNTMLGGTVGRASSPLIICHTNDLLRSPSFKIQAIKDIFRISIGVIQHFDITAGEVETRL